MFIHHARSEHVHGGQRPRIARKPTEAVSVSISALKMASYGIVALGKVHTRSAPSLGSLRKVALETVQCLSEAQMSTKGTFTVVLLCSCNKTSGEFSYGSKQSYMSFSCKIPQISIQKAACPNLCLEPVIWAHSPQLELSKHVSVHVATSNMVDRR